MGVDLRGGGAGRQDQVEQPVHRPRRGRVQRVRHRRVGAGQLDPGGQPDPVGQRDRRPAGLVGHLVRGQPAERPGVRQQPAEVRVGHRQVLDEPAQHVQQAQCPVLLVEPGRGDRRRRGRLVRQVHQRVVGEHREQRPGQLRAGQHCRCGVRREPEGVGHRRHRQLPLGTGVRVAGQGSGDGQQQRGLLGLGGVGHDRRCYRCGVHQGGELRVDELRRGGHRIGPTTVHDRGEAGQVRLGHPGHCGQQGTHARQVLLGGAAGSTAGRVAAYPLW